VSYTGTDRNIVFTDYLFDAGVIHVVSVYVSSAVYRGFNSRSGQTKHYKLCMCCFSAQHEERTKID
jgi:hypothetical protein